MPSFNRRHFVKAATGAAFATAFCQQPLVSLGQTSKPSKRVLIIGAGIAGIAAANALKAMGFSVTILEARNRIGGRINTASLGGQPVDLGAQWIEGINGNPIYTLCSNFGFKTVTSNYDSYSAYDIDGSRFSSTKANSLYSQVVSALDATETISSNLVRSGSPDISLQAGLNQAGLGSIGSTDADKRFAQWAKAWEAESSDAENAQYLSLRYYWDETEPNGFSGANNVLPGGYGQFVNQLAKGLDIRLGTVVKEIAYTSSGVTITASGQTFIGDFCVVTLPLGVLKSNAVKFTPALPASKLAAIRSLGVSLAHKVILRFANAAWPNQDFFGFTSSTDGLFVEWTNLNKYTGIPILSIWSHGDAARNLEKLTSAEAVAIATAAAQKMFPTLGNPTSAMVTNWGTDPYSLGAYSDVPLGAVSSMLDVMAQPVGRTLCFAGEATNHQYMATVHGAYLSGLREATRIASL